MYISTSSLHNQQIQKKSHFRFWFGFLFIASVGLNIFLLFFDQESNIAVASLTQDTGVISPVSVVSSKVFPEALSKEGPQSVVVIKPVS